MGVQALEQAENTFLELSVDADAVVLDRETPMAVLFSSGNLHKGRYGFPAVFYGIADDVLKQLLQLGCMDRERRQGTRFYSRAALRNGCGQVFIVGSPEGSGATSNGLSINRRYRRLNLPGA
jgi:hypothetical protein